MSRYIPVAAKRRALEVYRTRRVGGWSPVAPTGPLSPLDAMYATREFFAGHLAFWVARDKIPRELVDEYRAAEFYIKQLLRRPQDAAPAVSECSQSWGS